MNEFYSIVALRMIHLGKKPMRNIHHRDPMQPPIGLTYTLWEIAASFDLTISDVREMPKCLQKEFMALTNQPKLSKANRARINKQLRLYELWKAFDKRCYICGKPVPFSQVTRDHVYPKHLGFTLRNNIGIACQKCNARKGDAWPTLKQVWKADRALRRAGKKLFPVTNNDTYPHLRVQVVAEMRKRK